MAEPAIKVSELFYSLQGEGLYLGTPSIFLRTFGCNFTCSGFGMPRGEKSQERLNVDPDEMKYPVFGAGEPPVELTKKYTKYEDLPLVHTGCDSYASWDVRFKHLSPLLTIPAIVDRIQSLLPESKFSVNKHLILTGGEPMLPGWQKQFPALLQEIYNRKMDLGYLTFETNGTKPIIDDLYWELLNCSDFLEVVFSVSSKLPVSGEKWEDAIKPDVVQEYAKLRHSKLYFKWVVGSKQDIEDVERAIKEYDMPDVPVYLMPVGGTDKLYDVTHKDVAKMAMERGWRYSPRLQVELWKNAWGT
jgi:7-carboxy-7-deazaguanine synthase